MPSYLMFMGVGNLSPASTPSSTLAAPTAVDHVTMTLPTTTGYTLTPTNAGTIRKSGGTTLNYTKVLGPNGGYDGGADDTGTALAPITYSGGTPTASGSISTGLANDWGIIGNGIQWSIPLAAGVTKTVTVVGLTYGIVLNCTASLADASAASQTYLIDSTNSTTSAGKDVSWVVTPASATTMTISMLTQSTYAANNGNAHFMGCWIN